MSGLSYRAVRAALAGVDAQLTRLFSDLDDLALHFKDLVHGEQFRSTPPRRDDLSTLRPAIFDVLRAHEGLVTGAGVVAAPLLLSDAPYWLEWWWATPSGGHEALRVNLDPKAPDFFDYPTTDWYAEPIRTRKRRIAGPYVDYACTNGYSLTLATPAASGAAAAGVAAADVLVTSLERRVVPALHDIPGVVVLANHDGRVIASNSASWPPGLLVPGDAPRASAARARARTSPLRSWAIVDVGGS